MDLISDAIAGLSLVVSSVAIWLNRQEAGKRAEWERQQEHRQAVFNRPDLVPIGAALGGLLGGSGEAHRLRAGASHVIQVHNQGMSAPSEVWAVFFPSASYIVPNTMPQERADLQGTYWDARLDVTPAADGRGELRLQERRGPLRGDMSVVRGYVLSAPEEPSLGRALAGHGDFRCARLTITFRDRVGRRLASVFDLNAWDLNDWRRAMGPVEVNNDLCDLAEAA